MLPCENLYSGTHLSGQHYWEQNWPHLCTASTQASFFCVHSVHIHSVYSCSDLDTSCSDLKQQPLVFSWELCCTGWGDGVLLYLLGYSTQSPSASNSFKSFSLPKDEGEWSAFILFHSGHKELRDSWGGYRTPQNCGGRARDLKMAPQIHIVVRYLWMAVWWDGSMLCLKQVFVTSFRFRLIINCCSLVPKWRIATAEVLDEEMSVTVPLRGAWQCHTTAPPFDKKHSSEATLKHVPGTSATCWHRGEWNTRADRRTIQETSTGT